jgi:hypothetical protein
MTDIADELAGLRGFLAALEDPASEYRRNGVDIKPREIGVVKREVAHLAAVLERAARTDAASLPRFRP